MKRRVLQIGRAAFRHRLDGVLPTDALLENDLPRAARLLLKVWPGRWLPARGEGPAVRLRLFFEELGPVFIKFGQLLSTRRDLLPSGYADELAKLQDHVPPFPGADARVMVETALGDLFGARIEHFDEEPLASASIAQVHGAVLRSGEEVVFKVVRPGLERIVRDDLDVLIRLAAWIDRHVPASRRLHLPEVASDHARVVLGELDMMREAANAERLRDNFAGSPLLYVPRVYRDLTRPNVLAMERVRGIPIGNIDELRARGTNMKALADRGVETFFTQVFVHNFFHADMHPGNIFIDVEDPENPRYIALDCAIVGELESRDQDYLARNLVAFFNRDYGRVARLHFESGWIPQRTDEREFEAVIRDVCDPIFAKPLSQISFGHFLVELFRTAARFDMEIQPQLVLLQKTLLYIEGLGRQLYPELDLWRTAKPFMEGWMQERVGPLAMVRGFAERAPEILEQLPRLPELMLDTGRRLNGLESTLREQRASVRELEVSLARLRQGRRRRRLSGAALVIVATLLLWEPAMQASAEGLGAIAGLLSAAVGSYLLIRA